MLIKYYTMLIKYYTMLIKYNQPSDLNNFKRLFYHIFCGDVFRQTDTARSGIADFILARNLQKVSEENF